MCPLETLRAGSISCPQIRPQHLQWSASWPTATSLQREPGAIRPVPHVVSSPAVSRVQERGRTLDSHATAAGAAQTSFMQTQQANPSPQYPLVRAAIVPLNRPGEGPVMAPVYRGQLSNPVITTAQSVHGVSHSSQFPTYIVPVLSAGAQAEIGVGTGTVAGTAAAARPAATYTSFAEQNSVSIPRSRYLSLHQRDKQPRQSSHSHHQCIN